MILSYLFFLWSNGASGLPSRGSCLVNDHTFQKREKRKRKRHNQEKVSGFHVADMRHGLVDVSNQKQLSKEGGDAHCTPVPDVPALHPKGHPRHHSAQRTREVDPYDVITNSSVCRELDGQHVKAA